ncbi:hypothetical protein IscW_ISCW010357, partial [Ixodes scapularis]
QHIYIQVPPRYRHGHRDGRVDSCNSESGRANLTGCGKAEDRIKRRRHYRF